MDNLENIKQKTRMKLAVSNFQEEEKKIMPKKNIFKEVVAACFMVASLSGMVFAKDISTKIYENFWHTGNGIGKAMEEGYIEDVAMEEQPSGTNMTIEETGEVIEDLQTTVKVSDIVMDDFTLSMIIEVNLSEETLKIINPKDIWGFNFSDMIIYDENNNVITSNGQINRLEEYFGKDNYNDIGSGLNTFIENRGNNPARVVYNLYTGGDCIYPKSKKLNFKLYKIGVECAEDTLPGDEEITIKGNWEFEVDVPEKMYNRQSMSYIQTKTTNPNFNVTSAIVYDTGTNIKLEMKNQVMPKRPESSILEFYYSLPEGDELKNMEILNYLTAQEFQTEKFREFSQEQSDFWNFEKNLTNENGEKFEMTVGPRENGGSSVDDNNVRTFEGMFDLTRYDATDKIIMYVKDYQGNEGEITLERVDD